MSDVDGAATEAAGLGFHAYLRLQHRATVTQQQRPPPLELHHRLIGTEAREGIALEQRLDLGVGLRRCILAHGVQEVRRCDDRAPARVRGVFGIAVQGIVVTVTVGEVPNAVRGDLVVVRWIRLRLRHTEPQP